MGYYIQTLNRLPVTRKYDRLFITESIKLLDTLIGRESTNELLSSAIRVFDPYRKDPLTFPEDQDPRVTLFETAFSLMREDRLQTFLGSASHAFSSNDSRAIVCCSKCGNTWRSIVDENDEFGYVSCSKCQRKSPISRSILKSAKMFARQDQLTISKYI